MARAGRGSGSRSCGRARAAAKEAVVALSSSLRTQGPIRRAACCERRCLTTLMQPLTPVVLGPCVRRDDESVFNFQTAKNIPRREAPEVLHEHCPSRNEGAGNTGCTLHPRSRAQNCTKNAHEHTGSAEAFRHSLRNGVTAYIVLSPATGLSCHRRPRALART